MNKTELIELMAEKADISKSKAAQALEAMIGGIEASLNRDEDVVITGFGTFTKLSRKERTGRNPATGEEIRIPASVSPKFRPGKTFRDALK